MKINTRQKFWTYKKGWVANLLLSLLEGKEKREIRLATHLHCLKEERITSFSEKQART